MPRPDDQESVVFDLVADDGPEAAPDAVGPGPSGPPERRLPRLPRLSRRTWLLAAAVVVAMVVTTAAVDLVQDRRRAELMRTSSVGVVSLADPPAETWTVPFDVPAAPGQESFADQQQVVVMDGLLVVPPGSAQEYWVDPSTGAAEPAPVGFEDVVAVDAGSGEVAWRVPVGERPVCGPTGYDASLSTDVLVCVHGPEDAREVLAITPDGASTSRPVDLAEGERVFPGPDGTVVRLARVGDPAGSADCSTLGVCTPEHLSEGRDALVTVEDAGTGVERWTSTVEFVPVDSFNCRQDEPDGTATLEVDAVTARTGAETVTLEGCGIAATLSMEGVRLDLAGETGQVDPSFAWVDELGPGRFGVTEGTTTTVVDAAGEVVSDLNGMVERGPTSPDAPDDSSLLFVRSTGGIEAVREDGSVAWTDRYSQSVSLVGRDVVVMSRGIRTVGLDRQTGTELWSWSSEDSGGLISFRAVTDGETVAVQFLPQEGTGEARFVALDLSTGEQLWDVPMAGMAVAVGGQLVELAADGLHGLG